MDPAESRGLPASDAPTDGRASLSLSTYNMQPAAFSALLGGEVDACLGSNFFEGEMTADQPHAHPDRMSFASSNKDLYPPPIPLPVPDTLVSYCKALSNLDYHMGTGWMGELPTDFSPAESWAGDSLLLTTASLPPAAAATPSTPDLSSISPSADMPHQLPALPDYPTTASSTHLPASIGDNNADWRRIAGRCPECKRIFRDLRAHMISHQSERPDKCPVAACEYHIRGFARKHDRRRHTLGHFDGILVCGFCEAGVSAPGRIFQKAGHFKHHLHSEHGAVWRQPSRRRRDLLVFLGNSGRGSGEEGRASGYAERAGKCNVCDALFQRAQDLFDHLDDCLVRAVELAEACGGGVAGLYSIHM